MYNHAKKAYLSLNMDYLEFKQEAQVTVHHDRDKIWLNNFHFWLKWLVKVSRIFWSRADVLTHDSGVPVNSG